MAVLDNFLRAKPALSAHNLETIRMWWQNKPSNYLSTLSEEDSEQLLEDARKKAPEFQGYIQARKDKLHKELEEKLKKKQEKQEVREQKKSVTRSSGHKVLYSTGAHGKSPK